MPEERGLYPQMRLDEQVAYFARLHGLDEAAAARAASDWLERLGLGARGEDKVVSLSHGNQQRVQLAVALVHEPALLVLDEPFAGLDPEAVDALSTVLRERADAGAAILFSSHQLELVERICRRITIMDEGRVLADGTLPQLRRRFPAQLRVKVAAPPDWAAHVPGAEVVARRRGRSDPRHRPRGRSAIGAAGGAGGRARRALRLRDQRVDRPLPQADPRMTPAAAVRLIAWREIRERLQGRLLRVVTVLTALLVVAGVVLPTLINPAARPTRIGLVGPAAQAIAPQLERTAESSRMKIAVRRLADRAAATSELRGGRLDTALIVSPSGALIEVEQTLAPATRALLSETLAVAHLRGTLAAAGVSSATVASALAPLPVAVSALHRRPADQTARYVAAIAAALLMYVSLAMYGTAVAQGVAQEKTSRTAEVLIAAVRPGELLSGKVAGIGLCGLGQLAVAAGAALVASVIVHGAGIPGGVVAMIPAFLVYFLAGFVLYAFALAAAGAMVARQEEVQFATVPFTLLLLTGYGLVYAAAASPDATWLRIVSFLPPLTATLMPARIALGHVALWEFPVQALLMAAAIAGTVKLAGRIYAGALVLGGGRLTWRAAIRLGTARTGGPTRREQES